MSSNNETDSLEFLDVLKVYAEYRRNKKTFMDVCTTIFEWINSTENNQLESLNELRKYIPIYFVATKEVHKGAKIMWKKTIQEYQLNIILAKSSNKNEQEAFIKSECIKYGLDFTNENEKRDNEIKLNSSGFIIIDSSMDEFMKNNSSKLYEKKDCNTYNDNLRVVIESYDSYMNETSNFNSTFLIRSIINWMIYAKIDFKQAAEILNDKIFITFIISREHSDVYWLGEKKKYMVGFKIGEKTLPIDERLSNAGLYLSSQFE